MPLTLLPGGGTDWSVRKIGVIGPGIVGMPMAALLAAARVREGSEAPARVVVVQRDSPTSGWKVGEINAGRSPIGGVEPGLDAVVADAVGAGLLSASHDYGDLADADVVLVAVQTDKAGIGPDYGPLYEALDGLIPALARRPAGNVPLVVFESTLAPSSMATLIRDRFRAGGLVEGRDVLLANSPNRVMPGRLVERVAAADKLAGGLRPETPALVARLYGRIVTKGTVHPTSSLTAEVVKTLENAWRDVRIAFAAEVCRWCDGHDVDFFRLRDAVNARLARADGASADPTAVPVGSLLVPTVGVGGHCLPKDGILLWWRGVEAALPAADRSLILAARAVNDASPAWTLRLATHHLGDLSGRRVALLGAAYRADSEDTRNSPAFALARLLGDRGCDVVLHDPHVRPRDPNLVRLGLDARFTRDLGAALAGAQVAIACVAHRGYVDGGLDALAAAGVAVVDGCNLWRAADAGARGLAYCGLGRGAGAPPDGLVDFVVACFRAVDTAGANEVRDLCDFLNARYAATPFERVDFEEVRRLAATCATGCDIAPAGRPEPVGDWRGWVPGLAARAAG